MAKGTDLVTLKPEQYPALTPEVAQTIRENMAGESVSPADLSRIKVPAGGGKSWALPDGDAAKTITGILVHITRRRAYWANPDPTGDPPNCSSSDMEIGQGDPGGPCEACPCNVFGSAKKPDGSEGRGKACKEKKLLFMLREGQTLPDVVEIPPASLGALRQFQLKMGVPYWAMVTRLELREEKNKDGIKYAEVVPVKVGILGADQANAIRAYAEQLSSVFEAVTITPDEDSGETKEV